MEMCESLTTLLNKKIKAQLEDGVTAVVGEASGMSPQHSVQDSTSLIKTPLVFHLSSFWWQM